MSAPLVAPLAMHGAGNRFVLIDERPARIGDYANLARELCEARAGERGFDGILVVLDDPLAQARMRIFNADGGEAEMCGNGLRCVARYLAERGAPDAFEVATNAGPIPVEIRSRVADWAIRLTLGQPCFPAGLEGEMVVVGGVPRDAIRVETGNLHVVVPLDARAFGALEVARDGAALAADPRFLGCNVHFALRLADDALRVAHFERGVGPTQACGTGAVASAAAYLARGRLRSPVRVEVPGGTLVVGWELGGPASLEGPAVPLEFGARG
ncbi:MAG: diaminopimelate epimerase [Vulcanimicrobiaceae bacterium]